MGNRKSPHGLSASPAIRDSPERGLLTTRTDYLRGLFRRLGFLQAGAGPEIPAFAYMGVAVAAEIVAYLADPRFRPWFLGTLALSLLIIGAIAGSGIYYQTLERRGGPELQALEKLEQLRVRTIAWGVLALASAGLVLSIVRLFPWLSPLVIPPPLTGVTEIVVLVLTLAILALLSRYTTVATISHGETVVGAIQTLQGAIETKVGLPISDVARTLTEVNNRLAAVQNSADAAERARIEAVELRRHTVDLSLKSVKPGLVFNTVYLEVRSGEVSISSGAVDIEEAPRSGSGSSPRTVLSAVPTGQIAGASSSSIELFDVSKLTVGATVTLRGNFRFADGKSYGFSYQTRLLKTGLTRYQFEQLR